jgi:hypothetical protein
MHYKDAIKLLDELLTPSGFSRKGEVFSKPLKEDWSGVVALPGNDYFMQASFWLINETLSSLIQNSLAALDGVISGELKKNPIPAYQVSANGISFAGTTLRALEIRSNQVEPGDIEQLALFITNEAIPHLEKMTNIGRIAQILFEQNDAMSGHLGMFLIPAALLLADRSGDAEDKMNIARGIIGSNQKMTQLYSAYCASLLKNWKQ